MQIDILVLNYSKNNIFLKKKTNFSFTCFKNQIKFKNSYQISFK